MSIAPELSDHLEVERKLDVDADFQIPDLTALPAVADVTPARILHLTARYFDTADFMLAKHRITLRHRTGGDDAGWHLKLPAQGERLEIRTDPGDSAAVPDRLRRILTGYLRGRPLAMVARIDTTRTVRELRDAAGQVLAEIADDQVVGRAKRGPIPEQGRQRWREIEVELVGGGPALLTATTDALLAAGARMAGHASKAGRVLAAAQPSSVPPQRGDADAVSRYIAGQVAALWAADPLVRLDRDEAVHDMRVAVRRLRSVLREFPTSIDDSIALEAELRWLAGELSALRDMEVLHERFAELVPNLPPRLQGSGAPALLQAIETAQHNARDRAMRALGADRYLHLLDSLETAHIRRAGIDPVTMSRTLRRRLGKLLVAVDDADLAPDTTEARHHARKAAKRARYTAEAVAPELGKPATRLAGIAKDVQELLGRYTDAVVARRYLERLGFGGDDGAAVTAMIGLEASAEHAALAESERAWPRLRSSAKRALAHLL